MTTEVINLRHGHPYDVRIDRQSRWGNPFVMGRDGNREEVIAKYRAWIVTQPELMADVHILKGKRLGCWCAPEACHGHVLAELAERSNMPIDSFSGVHEFLSNFYPSPILFDGYEAATVEHAYQAAKTHDPAERQRIISLRTPAEAKRAGAKAKLRPDWEDGAKDRVMMECLFLKFTMHPNLKQALINTGTAQLTEGNHWNDTYWGVCNGEGLNKLGQMLMALRRTLGGQ